MFILFSIAPNVRQGYLQLHIYFLILIEKSSESVSHAVVTAVVFSLGDWEIGIVPWRSCMLDTGVARQVVRDRLTMTDEHEGIH